MARHNEKHHRGIPSAPSSSRRPPCHHNVASTSPNKPLPAAPPRHRQHHPSRIRHREKGPTSQPDGAWPQSTPARQGRGAVPATRARNRTPHGRCGRGTPTTRRLAGRWTGPTATAVGSRRKPRDPTCRGPWVPDPVAEVVDQADHKADLVAAGRQQPPRRGRRHHGSNYTRARGRGERRRGRVVPPRPPSLRPRGPPTADPAPARRRAGKRRGGGARGCASAHVALKGTTRGDEDLLQ